MVLKWNCCVPLCMNKWRNSPNLKMYPLPSDETVWKEYAGLFRNENVCDSSSTRICGEHFTGGERVTRNQLLSIFPWTKEVNPRRESLLHLLHHLSATSKKRRADGEVNASITRTKQGQAEGLSETAETTDVLTIDPPVPTKENETLTESAEYSTEKETLRLELEKLKAEVKILKYEQEYDPVYDIDDYKTIDRDTSLYTGFANYETMVLFHTAVTAAKAVETSVTSTNSLFQDYTNLDDQFPQTCHDSPRFKPFTLLRYCFNMLKPKLCNISYESYARSQFDHERPGRLRKLSQWQEYTMVLMRIRSGLFARDLTHRFRVSEDIVSVIFRAWIKFMRAELELVCILWPAKKQIKYHMPAVFKEFYPDLVSIIDCTEIFMECLSGLDNQSTCYSH